MIMRKYMNILSVVAIVSIAAGNRSTVSAALSAATGVDTKSAPIQVLGTQNKLSARLTFTASGEPSFKVRPIKEGVEITSKSDAPLQVDQLPHLREVDGIEQRTEGDTRIAVVHFAKDCCQIQQHHAGHSLKIDLLGWHLKTAPTGSATTSGEGAKAPKLTASADTLPAKTYSDDLKPSAAAKSEPKASPVPVKSAAEKSGGSLRNSASQKTAELGALRDDLAGRLSLFNAMPSPDRLAGTSPTANELLAASGDRAIKPVPALVKPACPPEFKMDGWRGAEPFADRLQSLRTLTARSDEGPEALAALAEFYIGNGLGGEALAVAQEAKLAGLTADIRRRLQRDVDLGRLVDGAPVAANSVLLDSPGNCDRADAPLWRAVSAVASGDRDTIVRNSDAAARALSALPQPLSNMLAFRIADAVPDDANVTQAMSAAIKDTIPTTSEETAARFLLQARIARARKDDTDDRNFLQRAAQDVGITGLKARLELAELPTTDEGKADDQREALLADAARVHRDVSFGRNAASVLSELKLQRGDYTGALRVANDSAPLSDTQQPDSHGATLAARVLRQLLVDKSGPNLPSPEQRLVIYWHYSGYATPGEKGDDIRRGAAALMLDQGMPEAALKLVRQLAPATIAARDGAVLYARAEARAGDPEHALALLKGLSSDNETQHIAVDALVRQHKWLEAAKQLDGAKDLTDKLRRAALLYDGRDWAAAVEAYAGALRDPALPENSRKQVAEQYALAVALSGKPPAEELKGFSGLADQMLAAFPGVVDTQQLQQQQAVAALRGSLQRAGQIETILPPAAKPTARGG